MLTLLVRSCYLEKLDKWKELMQAERCEAACDVQSQPTANKALIGVGAILGGALLFVTEIDTVLEVAGIFAAGNFAFRNLLFADDRKRTQGDIKQASLPVLLYTITMKIVYTHITIDSTAAVHFTSHAHAMGSRACASELQECTSEPATCPTTLSPEQAQLSHPSQCGRTHRCGHECAVSAERLWMTRSVPRSCQRTCSG